MPNVDKQSQKIELHVDATAASPEEPPEPTAVLGDEPAAEQSVSPSSDGPHRLHSLLHKIGTARCRARWEALSGSESVRRCPACDCNIYRAQGMNETELLGLMIENEDTADLSGRHLYRRADGTFMLEKGKCSSTLTYQISIGLIVIAVLAAWTRMPDIGPVGLPQLLMLVACSLMAANSLRENIKRKRVTWFAAGTYLIWLASAFAYLLMLVTPLPFGYVGVEAKILLAVITPVSYGLAIICYGMSFFGWLVRKATGGHNQADHGETKCPT